MLFTLHDNYSHDKPVGGGEKSMKPFPPGDDVRKPTNIHSSVKQ